MDSLFKRNPFDILELKNNASVKDIDHNYHKVLGMITLKISGADEYSTVMGVEKRNENDVREAAAVLKNPHKRLFYAFWHYDDLSLERSRFIKQAEVIIDYMEAIGFHNRKDSKL